MNEQDKNTYQQNEETLKEYYRTRDLDLRNKIFFANQGLVVNIAKEMSSAYSKRASTGDLFAELKQEGDLALLEAIDHFNPDYGNALSTYATPYIKNAMRNYLNEVLPQIPLPAKIRQRLFAFDKAEAILTGKLLRKPTSQEIASFLHDGTTAEEIESLRAGAYYATTTSLQKTRTNKDGEEKEEDVASSKASDEDDPAEAAAKKEEDEVLSKAIASLDERHRDILLSRNGFNGKTKTLAELAKKYGISIERTRQLENEAEKKVKQYMEKALG